MNRQEYERDRWRTDPRRRANHLRRLAERRQYVADYLAGHPCVDCGEDDPIVLEFDHVRGEKLGNIADMIVRNGIEVLRAEIAKCEVRCANCHRRITYYRRIGEHR